MSQNTNDLRVNDLEKAGLSSNENNFLLPSSFQNPFSVAWSKLVNLIWAENSQAIQDEPDEITLDQFYSHFTDRVDPSLHYTIFSPYDRF